MLIRRSKFFNPLDQIWEQLNGLLTRENFADDFLKEIERPPTVDTVLPENPVDGQLTYFVASDPNSIVWQLRYRKSLGYWEYVGGTPLFDTSGATSGTRSNIAYGATSGAASPSVTVPLAGDYLVEYDAAVSFVATDRAFMTVKLGAAASSDTQAMFFAGETAGGSEEGNLARTQALTGLTAGEVLQIEMRSTNGTACVYSRRRLAIAPIRVSP